MKANPISRRAIVFGSAGLAALPKIEPEHAYLFATAEYNIRMTLEFYDAYTNRGLLLKERTSGRLFCLSGTGEENRNCLKNFTGSLAIARYRILSRNGLVASLSIREYVRNIDGSDLISTRPPFERIIATQGGLASDIQAFGYEHSPPPGQPSEWASLQDELWCLLRQDLFLSDKQRPFLIVHWKHTLREIRVLDVIPGAGTTRV